MLEDPRALGLFELADTEPSGDPPRSKIQLMITGSFVHGKSGKFEITKENLAEFAEDINTRGDKRIPIDYDHSFVDRGDTRAAGWFAMGTAEVRAHEDGTSSLWAEVEWTPAAAAAIRSGEFRFISPEFSFKDMDIQSGKKVDKRKMHAAALTNRPFFRTMEPVTLSDQTLEEVIAASRMDSVSEEQIQKASEKFGPAFEVVMRATRSDSMTPADRMELATIARSVLTTTTSSTASAWFVADSDKPERSTDVELEKLAEVFGLTDATEADVIAAAEAAAQEKADLTARIEDLEKNLEASEKTQLPKDQIESLIASAARGEEAAKELSNMRRETLLSGAVESGKILPVQLDAYRTMYDMNPESVTKLIEATPDRSVFSTKEVGSGNEAESVAGEKPAPIEIDGSAYEVSDDSWATHAAAMAILAEEGKLTDHSEDEYIRALSVAQTRKS